MRRLKIFFLYIFLPCFVLWTAGFLWFASKINTPPAYTDVKTQAIVVLTGGTERVGAGVELLKQGKGEKLFISGVNQSIDWPLLSQTIDILPDEVADKITLGHAAYDTWDNALESKYWMQKNGFTALRLVTASYHMPRSLSEFKHVMPKYVIIPHPVFPSSFKHDEWWKWPGTTALIATEYTKYLLVSLRHLIPFIPDKITFNNQ